MSGGSAGSPTQASAAARLLPELLACPSVQRGCVRAPPGRPPLPHSPFDHSAASGPGMALLGWLARWAELPGEETRQRGKGQHRSDGAHAARCAPLPALPKLLEPLPHCPCCSQALPAMQAAAAVVPVRTALVAAAASLLAAPLLALRHLLALQAAPLRAAWATALWLRLWLAAAAGAVQWQRRRCPALVVLYEPCVVRLVVSAALRCAAAPAPVRQAATELHIVAPPSTHTPRAGITATCRPPAPRWPPPWRPPPPTCHGAACPP